MFDGCRRWWRSESVFDTLDANECKLAKAWGRGLMPMWLLLKRMGVNLALSLL